MSLSIKKEDRVMVLAGKDRGKVGKVLKVDPSKERALVEKVNIVKRHTRPGGKSQGGVLEKEAPIHVSNLLVVCGKCNQPSKVGRKALEDGKRARYCKKCGELLDN